MEKVWNQANAANDQCSSIKRLLPLILAALSLYPVLSSADDESTGSDREDMKQAMSRAWDITLGGGAVAEPRYDGSKRYLLKPFPFFSIRYHDLVSASVVDGIRLNVIHTDGLHAGPVLTYSEGRSPSDDALLANLKNIPPSINAGGFATYQFGSFEVLAQVDQAVLHQQNGLTGKLRLTYQEQFSFVGHRAVLETGPEVEFANREFETTWFGITAPESARSGLRQFAPSSGLMDVGVRSSLTVQQSRHVLIRAVVNVKELTGNTADSPLTTSKTQAFVGFGAGYKF
jgi:MipA family protein